MKKMLLLFAGILFGITFSASGNLPLPASDEHSPEMSQSANSSSSDVTIYADLSGGVYPVGGVEISNYHPFSCEIWDGKLPSGSYFDIDGGELRIHLPESPYPFVEYADICIRHGVFAYRFCITIYQGCD